MDATTLQGAILLASYALFLLAFTTSYRINSIRRTKAQEGSAEITRPRIIYWAALLITLTGFAKEATVSAALFVLTYLLLALTFAARHPKEDSTDHYSTILLLLGICLYGTALNHEFEGYLEGRTHVLGTFHIIGIITGIGIIARYAKVMKHDHSETIWNLWIRKRRARNKRAMRRAAMITALLLITGAAQSQIIAKTHEKEGNTTRTVVLEKDPHYYCERYELTENLCVEDANSTCESACCIITRTPQGWQLRGTATYQQGEAQQARVWLNYLLPLGRIDFNDPQEAVNAIRQTWKPQKKEII